MRPPESSQNDEDTSECPLAPKCCPESTEKAISNKDDTGPSSEESQNNTQDEIPTVDNQVKSGKNTDKLSSASDSPKANSNSNDKINFNSSASNLTRQPNQTNPSSSSQTSLNITLSPQSSSASTLNSIHPETVQANRTNAFNGSLTNNLASPSTFVTPSAARATSAQQQSQYQNQMRNVKQKSELFMQNQSFNTYQQQQHHNKGPNQGHNHYQHSHHNHHHNSHQHHHPNNSGTTINTNTNNNNINNNNNNNNNHNNNEQLSRTNLYIRGLDSDTNDSDLFSLCNRFGSIVSTKAILDKNTNKCKGYGFVDFETPAAAELAVTELQKQGVLVHMAKQQEADPTNLYIANLPPLMTEPELEAILEPYGRVVSTRILINQNRQPRGVGFARMETKEQCDSIIASLNGQTVKNSKEPLLIKFADGANKKRVHHFQHKPLPNASFGDQMWRNNGNETNYHLMNISAENRSFHGSSYEHNRQGQKAQHVGHNNGAIKHQQMINTIPNFHQQVADHHQHPSAPHGHQQHNRSQLLQHHGHNHSSHTSHRNQNQAPYSGGSNFPISGNMNATNDGGHWLHPSQAGQPYMLQAQMMAVSPSLHYVNLGNQMQGLQIGNPAVSGYLSPPQWPQWPLWPSGVGVKPANNSQNSSQGPNSAGAGYTETD